MFEQSSSSVKIVVITTADIFAYMKVSQALELLQKREYMPARQTSHRNWDKLFLAVSHFTVVSLVTWPWSGSEAGADPVFLKTLLLFTCKSCSSHAFLFVFTYDKQEGLYQNKVNSSLASTQRPGH